jgi:predicted Zn-dependent protease
MALNKILFGAALGLFGLAACVTNEETGRTHIAPMPDSFMNPMGVQAYAQMKQEAPISKNAAQTAKITEIARRVAAATGKNLNWEYTVFESKEVNAWCLPGGKIGVYTGIIPVARTNAGLAAVIGHEIAHATLRHGGERASSQLALAGIMVGAELTADSVMRDDKLRSYLMAALGLGAQLGIVLPFSRAQEAEADEVGLEYMAKAGYDPHEAIGLWERMAKLGGTPPAILSDHPSNESRIQAMEQEQAKVRPLYEASAKQPTTAL